MDTESRPAPAPKASTLPRLSKLPLPRSGTEREAVCSPDQPPSRPTSSLREKYGSHARSVSLQVNNRDSVSAAPPKPVHPEFKIDSRPGRVNQPSRALKQPLKPTLRPQSQQDSHKSTNGAFGACLHEDKGITHPSQQENVIQEQDGHDSSSGSSGTSPHTSPTASTNSETQELKIPKKSRPSLSDRTIESLSQVPPSPANSRRRSGFFAPASPMTPQRAASTTGRPTPVSTIEYGSVRRTSFIRPPSPSKIGHTRQASAVSAQRNTSSFLPKSPQPTNTFGTGPRRPVNPVKTAQRASTTVPKLKSSFERANKPGQGALRGATEPAKALQNTSAKFTTPDDQQSPSSSSEALRQRIAKAKAERRAALKKEAEGQPASATTYDFENCENPFNQKSKDNMEPLRARVDHARRDGKLNIAAMNLTALPIEVVQMYEPSAMESSSVPWDETVDLTRLIAADNSIAELREDEFPDISIEDLQSSNDPEAKGSQFGGLESLDLHGNKLHSIPLGLRRLSRLTSINLTRNNLDNWAFDVITQITTLREVSLGQNNLTNELPESIRLLTNLDTLDVSSNKLTMLPSSLRDLKSLRCLSLSSNRLTSLPFDCLAQLPTLANVSAASNALTGALFPSSVSKMTNLQILDVADNAIASLTFSRNLQLPAITRLDVSNNRLGAFPNISTWTNLIALLAEGNCLRNLPQGMTDLGATLKTVNLERNDLRSLEPEQGIAAMQSLDSLLLSGNPLRERRLLNMSTDEIKRDMERKVELAEKVKSG